MSTSTIASSCFATGFIDIAARDELEKYQYSTRRAYTYFVRETRKCTPFTQIPVVLARASGQPGFAQEWAVSVSRTGDYLLHAWLRVTVPEVTLLDSNPHGADGRIRWTRNLMHNLIKEVAITFSEMPAERFDNHFLDFWSAFTTVASKRAGYDVMVGNVDELIAPHPPNAPLASKTLNLPLPFFFTRDTGLALPTAALPFNEIRFTFQFRDWDELLILETGTPAAGVRNGGAPEVGVSISTAPKLTNVNVWCNYVLLSKEERAQMGQCQREMLIEQVQYAPRQTFEPATNPNKMFDLRFSHAVKALFFGVRNTTFPNVWSNYTTASPVIDDRLVDFEPAGAHDPILNTTLIYESSARFADVGADYFSHVNPWYHAPAIPEPIGYHLYSYSLDLTRVDPMGSTNFGKLTNVSIVPKSAPAALVGAGGTGAAGSGMDVPQSYEFITIALNNNVIRIANGVLGFPVM